MCHSKDRLAFTSCRLWQIIISGFIGFISCVWADVVSGHPCKMHLGPNHKQLYQLGFFFLLKWRYCLCIQVNTYFFFIMPGIWVWLCSFGAQCLLPKVGLLKHTYSETSDKIFQNRVALISTVLELSLVSKCINQTT